MCLVGRFERRADRAREARELLAWSPEGSLRFTEEELSLIGFALTRLSSVEIVQRLQCSTEKADTCRSTLLGKVDGARTSPPDLPIVSLAEDRLAIEISDHIVRCKPVSFQLLTYLVRHRGSWVRAEALRREVLRASMQPGASNVRWHVLQARRSLGPLSTALHSDNRLGFMFELGDCGQQHCSRRGES